MLRMFHRILGQENPNKNYISLYDSRCTEFFLGTGEKADENSADPTGNVILKLLNQELLFGHLSLHDITNRDNTHHRITIENG